MNVVVVESPAKAKTINKYLGPGYTVLASFGHVRDLPAKNGSVQPDQDFSMVWELAERAAGRISDIAKAVKGAKHLYLATDPDREGEAISWHVRDVLEQRHALKGVDVKRVVFNEVTKSAVLDAMKHPRELDQDLIDAYLARRALDYLVGFTLSPVLWRKLPGSRSAGRVQSVALRLICEREAEIEAFKPREYWTVTATLGKPGERTFPARLTHLDGRKLDKFDLNDEASAKRAVDAVENGAFAVAAVEKRQAKRHPQPPFTTSTLQQEASRKLGFGALRTMRAAQRLYEGMDVGSGPVGLITYMRTDSVQMAREAVDGVRHHIDSRFGREYLPAAPRTYRSTAKNAQEAHEAVRPTDFSLTPEQARRYLDDEHFKLYELVWKRAVASQMESALFDQVAVDMTAPDKRATLRATGSVVVFDGFLRLYHEDMDDPADENGETAILPPLAEGDGLVRYGVLPEQHFTQPPPRYSEASLVKRLEELGIGRPSTYASIIQTLQERKYVTLEKRRLIPQDRGRVVTAFLANFFERYVRYDFTAQLEDQLDEVSAGRIPWKKLLTEFWREFARAVDATKDLSVKNVLAELDNDLGPHFFPVIDPTKDPRLCPGCTQGRLGLKLGKFGAFIGCSRYPECGYTRPLAVPSGENGESAVLGASGSVNLGTDPKTGQPVTLRKGPYGLYVQLGEAGAEKGATKPKRASLPKGLAPADVDLEKALGLLSLPRDVGLHPETGLPITAAIGRFGPYLKHEGAFASLPADEDVLTVGLNRAVDLLAQAHAKAMSKSKPIGDHPADGKPILLQRGRFGSFLRHGAERVSLPHGQAKDDLTLERAVEILAAPPQPTGKKPAGKKLAGKKAGAKKADAKAAAEGKSAPKKSAKKAGGKSATRTRAKSGTARTKTAPAAAETPSEAE